MGTTLGSHSLPPTRLGSPLQRSHHPEGPKKTVSDKFSTSWTRLLDLCEEDLLAILEGMNSIECNRILLEGRPIHDLQLLLQYGLGLPNRYKKLWRDNRCWTALRDSASCLICALFAACGRFAGEALKVDCANEHQRRVSCGEQCINQPVDKILPLAKQRVVDQRKLLGSSAPFARASPNGLYAVFWGRKTKWLPQSPHAWQVARDPRLGSMKFEIPPGSIPELLTGFSGFIANKKLRSARARSSVFC